MNDKKYIIDPLTALCKVSLLYFMAEKTRLAINCHVLHIQNYSYRQWIDRMKNGDSRVDISNLNAPFMKVVCWYLVDGPERVEMDQETINSIQVITQFAIKGLSKLQNSTYDDDITIKIILQYFINLLRDSLNGVCKEENCVQIDNNNVLSERIKMNYEAHTINSISKMLIDADKIDNSINDINVLISCAHQLLLNRDTAFVKMMKEINTVL